MINRNDIKKLLIDCNITAAEVARRLNMTPQAFNSFLTKNFTQKDLQLIADTVGVEYISEFKLKEKKPAEEDAQNI